MFTHPRDRVLTYHAISLPAAGTLGLDAFGGHGLDLFRHDGGVVLNRWEEVCLIVSHEATEFVEKSNLVLLQGRKQYLESGTMDYVHGRLGDNKLVVR